MLGSRAEEDVRSCDVAVEDGVFFKSNSTAGDQRAVELAKDECAVGLNSYGAVDVA